MNYETGTGRVWDPNPEGHGIAHILPDHDVDDQSYSPAYSIKSLQGLNSPESGLYYLKGEYASSFDLAAPTGLIQGQSTSDFIFNRSQIGFEETNCYYHTDKLLRYLNSLGFNPTWNNQTTTSNKDVVFDARAGNQGDLPVYIGFGQVKFPYPSGIAPGADAGEDESVIVHEIGHAVHDALLPFGIMGSSHTDLYGISEGIANYIGIDYRRQTTLIKSTWGSLWYMPGDLINNSLNFAANWVPLSPRTCSGVWAGALFDLEYVSATDPSQGIRLGRDVVTTNQLSALSYLTATSTKLDNVLAMYQADLDIYEGLHLREYIDVYHNRQLFNDQNVYGNISANQNWSGYKKINSTIHALSGTTINIAANSVIVMDGELFVDQGATINIGANVRFIGYSSTHRVVITGNATIGNNVEFKFVGIPGSTDYFAGLSLMNQSQAITLTNATFTKTRLFHNGGGLTVTNSTFTDCNNIMSYRGNITFSTCNFIKTGVYCQNQPLDANSLCIINNSCTFDGESSSYGIYLQGYKKYIIKSNYFTNYSSGIKLSNCGSGLTGYQTIEDNMITGCGQIGIQNYYSKSEIKNNRIYNCGIGLGLYNTSNVSVTGNQNAPNYVNTQQIYNNTSYEVLTSYSSFPLPFNYNVIYDSDNAGGQSDALVYSIPPSTGLFIPNVKNNCWGSNFNASDDFYCSTGCTFSYIPTWCPPGEKSSLLEEDAETLYNQAIEHMNSNDFNNAKVSFENVIQNYPSTNYASSALKGLFLVEELTNNNFTELKNYYTTNDSIVGNELLHQIGDILANKCNEKLGQWSDCILWYENKILNSHNQEDSTYAVIDLGNLYLLMQSSGSKSIQTGKLKQYIPEDKDKFEKNCDFLLSLLPGNGNRLQDPFSIHTTMGKLLQNVPNPFSQYTEIWFEVEKQSNIEIEISDNTGRILKSINVGFVNKGKNKVNFNSNGLANGIYFYSLKIDGNISDTKKMSILN